MRVSLLLIGFLGAGVVGALAGALAGGADPLPASAAPESPDLEPRIGRIEAALARLEADLLEWRSEVRPALEAARAAETAELAPAEPVEPVAEAPVSDAAFEARVLAVVKEREEREREDRNRRRAALFAERDSTNVERLGESLGLTAHQQEAMERILAARREAVLALREEMLGDGPPDRSRMGEFRERMREVTTKADEEVKSLLSADQYDAWRAQDRSRGPGGGRFGGRPGGGR